MSVLAQEALAVVSTALPALCQDLVNLVAAYAAKTDQIGCNRVREDADKVSDRRYFCRRSGCMLNPASFKCDDLLALPAAECVEKTAAPRCYPGWNTTEYYALLVKLGDRITECVLTYDPARALWCVNNLGMATNHFDLSALLRRLREGRWKAPSCEGIGFNAPCMDEYVGPAEAAFLYAAR